MLAVLLGFAGVIVAAIIGAWAVLRTRHPTPSQLELVDVAVGAAAAKNDDAVVFDIKVRNIGGQPAVIKRLVVHIERASSMYVRTVLPVYSKVTFAAQMLAITATYDVTLPSPGKLADRRADVTVNLGQVVKAGEADRFQIRAGHGYSSSAGYLVRLELLHDADRSVESSLLAVAAPVPGAQTVITPRDIRDALVRFCDQVDEIRRGVDADIAAAGLAAADWLASPPRSRDKLPERLPSFEQYSVVFDEFWDPPRAIEEYLAGIEQQYRTLIDIGEMAAIVPDSLRDLMPQMRATLAELPSLRAEFG
ncbi:MAG TPA: hypothetical protein VEV63_06015 [Streptosporangiaceae bacterium]|nr:hypothetical protein [Streptosporangiaceae bacterium]